MSFWFRPEERRGAAARGSRSARASACVDRLRLDAPDQSHMPSLGRIWCYVGVAGGAEARGSDQAFGADPARARRSMTHCLRAAPATLAISDWRASVVGGS
jgi:hypothetical protein